MVPSFIPSKCNIWLSDKLLLLSIFSIISEVHYICSPIHYQAKLSSEWDYYMGIAGCIFLSIRWCWKNSRHNLHVYMNSSKFNWAKSASFAQSDTDDIHSPSFTEILVECPWRSYRQLLDDNVPRAGFEPPSSHPTNFQGMWVQIPLKFRAKEFFLQLNCHPARSCQSSFGLTFWQLLRAREFTCLNTSIYILSPTYFIFEPVMSSSMCIHDRLPALCSSRLTRIGAKNGFLTSKGL